MKAQITRSILIRLTLIASLIGLLVTMSTRMQADSGACGGPTTVPFTDVAGSIFFCDIAEAFFSGLTNGTTPTTYSPSQNVPRDQMAAFITRTLDQSLARGSRRAALSQWWTPQDASNLRTTSVGSFPTGIVSDGLDLWVANGGSNTVSRVRASDGSYLGTWTGVFQPQATLFAEGLVFVVGIDNVLYDLDPAQPPGAVTPLATVGDLPASLTFDGHRCWTANLVGGSVSIVSFSPFSVTNVTTGFGAPYGIIFDGSNIWVTDSQDKTLKKLDSSGHILLSVAAAGEGFPVFDGTNIWVPNNNNNSVSVIRATGGLSGTVLAVLSGNGLDQPVTAAFDGARVLVTNSGSVSLWRASDFSPLGSFGTGTNTLPHGACCDGVNFWITFSNGSTIARF
jgi:hypothetical protein